VLPLESSAGALLLRSKSFALAVNAIAPGIVDTPMHNPEHHESLKHLHPVQRLTTVQEIVDAALFLVIPAFDRLREAGHRNPSRRNILPPACLAANTPDARNGLGSAQFHQA
jgi:NAD(P)-dependent dehydrogenase (short-subunit alcohol dehydrogenase family)